MATGDYMNLYEKEMSNILFDLVDKHGVVGVKTSFEDEGASFNEMVRLKETANQSGTKLNIKIGGPEAKRDIKDAMVIGTKGIVAPMVESPYGLEKFVKSVESIVYDSESLQSLNLAVNVETITSVENLDKILQSDVISKIYGITIGRVDLIGSMGIDRSQINSETVYKTVSESFYKIKKAGLKTMMGGGVDINSKSFVERLHKDGLLDKIETRYVMFELVECLSDFGNNLSKAQKFELTWLANKNKMYSYMADHEKSRIDMIQGRLLSEK